MFQLWKVVNGAPKAQPMYWKSSKYKDPERLGEIGAITSKYMTVVNSVGACLFGAFLGAKRIRIFDWMNAATGWDFTPNQYLDKAADIHTLKQAFNVKHGLEPKKIKISERALGRPVQKEGANKGRSVEIEAMMSRYWEQFGWDGDTGKPSVEQVEKIAAGS